MLPKTIDRRSGRIFEYKLKDLCVCRSQQDQEDYGVDYELEMLNEGGKATGIILKVQQKGAEHVSVSQDGKWISYSDLPVEKMKYYLSDLSIPIFFVVVDATDERMWWTRLQGELEVENAYQAAVAANQKTMTVRLPAANTLPATLDKMFEARDAAKTSILLRELRSTTAASIVAAAKSDLASNKQLLIEQANVLRSAEIEMLRAKGSYSEVYKQVSTIFNSPSEQIEMRFSAALHMLGTFPSVAMRSSDEERAKEILQNRINITESLFNLTLERNDKINLHAFSRVLYRSTLLAKVVGQEIGLRLTLSFRFRSENSPVSADTHATHLVATERVLRAFHRVQIGFNRLIKLSAYGFTPFSWRQLSMDIVPFLLNLDGGGLNDIKLEIIEWLDSTLPLVLAAAQQMQDWNAMSVCAISFSQYALAFVDDKVMYDKRIVFARSIVETVPDAAIKAKFLNVIDSMVAELAAARR